MDDYIYKSEEPYWGFSSWNDFFTREVKKGARPIDGKNDNKVVVASCDSTVYKIGRNVQAQSEFWIKAQSCIGYDPKKAYVKEGLYFSQATSEGEDPTDQDHSGGIRLYLIIDDSIFRLG